MKLYDFLSLTEKDYELTVWDEDYDIETYFYNITDAEDSWDMSMIELSKLLEIKSFHNNGVVVDLSKVIESHLTAIKQANLFTDCDIDAIMDCIGYAISGNVSEEWMEIFVNTLKNDYYFEAVEYCPYCDSEITYPMWDVTVKGYVVTCPHCGKEQFLCDECIHAEDELNKNSCACDWHETECGSQCFRGIAKD